MMSPEPLPPSSLAVVLDNIRSAFNVGSIFRTADACGAGPILLCGMTAHPPNLKLAKTALGAEQSVAWERFKQTADALDALDARGIPVVAVEIGPRAAVYAEFDWPPEVALLFGHEVTGIAPELLDRCAGVVSIPMYGEKNSLNVATAAGIVLYEILRKRGALALPPRGAQHGFGLP